MRLIEGLFSKIIEANSLSNEDKIAYEILLQYPLSPNCKCEYCKNPKLPKNKINSLISIKGEPLKDCPHSYIKSYHYFYLDAFYLHKNFNVPLDLKTSPNKYVETMYFLDQLVREIKNQQYKRLENKAKHGRR